MNTMRACILSIILISSISTTVKAQEPVYWDVVQQIREEGFERSEVMETASYLTDVFGPRLAHSPSYYDALDWVQERLEDYGLKNVQKEPWGEFGLGWENQYTSVHIIKPRYMPVIAYPNAWSSGTDGKVTGPVVYVNFQELKSDDDLRRYRGKVKGAIIFLIPEIPLSQNFDPDAVRFSQKDLDERSQTVIEVPSDDEDMPELNFDIENDRLTFKDIMEYLASEGAAVFAFPDWQGGDDGTVYVFGELVKSEDEIVPYSSITMATEHYNRIVRILEKDIPVEMEVEVRTSFTKNTIDHNIVAEIPGTDLSDELVMFGGHFDATSAGTGATDNGAGSSIVIEAVWILKALEIKPRRTIRAALWGAEEEGLLGSIGYVQNHFGDPLSGKFTDEQEKVAAYFNMDNGTGRFRGVYLQGNELVRPIFTEWMKPFHDLGMRHLWPEFTGGTDHLSFNAVGLPGFQFIQDEVEYGSRTHHSNMDVYDRLVPEDLMQAAVIMASFVYHAAMRDEKLPRSDKQTEWGANVIKRILSRNQ